MRLVEADMIKLERNRGFRVVIPGPANIVDAFQLRLLLEVPAACRAALTVREAFLSKRADRRLSLCAHAGPSFRQFRGTLGFGLTLVAGGGQAGGVGGAGWSSSSWRGRCLATAWYMDCAPARAEVRSAGCGISRSASAMMMRACSAIAVHISGLAPATSAQALRSRSSASATVGSWLP
jgi:hypothetical protein